jgi:hypothetical protein
MVGTPLRIVVRRLVAFIVLAALVVAALPGARAQSEVRYFPETGHTLRGQFRVFWETNGAIANFGFPITEEYTGPNGRTIQYFERARFELNEVGGRAVVELGLLGIEVTGGRIFPKVPPIENTADRRYIPETQHIIQYGFKEIWETRGDVRIFGFPISEEIDEVLEDGEWRTVQYFERARFEYWPNFPPGQRVLISHLGRRLAPAERTAPVPPPGSGQPAPQPQPQPQPQPAPAPLPPSVNATVTPPEGPQGTTFSFAAFGFEPGENVGIWITAPDQSTFGADFQAVADGEGSIASENIGLGTDGSFPEGIWSFNAQGVRSGRQAIGYFRIAAVTAPAGDPNRLGQLIHDQLPRQGLSFILPVAAPPGAEFIMLGGEFDPNEAVAGWVTRPDNTSFPIPPEQIVKDGTVVQALVTTAGLGEGTYTAVLTGQSTGVVAAASFRLTFDFVAGPGTPRPANVNGGVSPSEGPQGTTFQVRGGGLRPNELAEFWITDPLGNYVLYPEAIPAEGDGRIGYNPPLDLTATMEAPAGVYGIHFRGIESGVRIDVYFTVTGTAGQGSPGAALRMAEQLLAKDRLPRPALWIRR